MKTLMSRHALNFHKPCATGLRAEGGWWGARLGLCWVTPLVALGARRQLCAADLFELPAELQPGACAAVLWREWSQACCAPAPSALMYKVMLPFKTFVRAAERIAVAARQVWPSEG